MGEADADAAPKDRSRRIFNALGVQQQARLKEEADEFAEPVVDEAYKLKMEALEKYRQQQSGREKELALAEKRREKRLQRGGQPHAGRLAKLEAASGAAGRRASATFEAEQAEASTSPGGLRSRVHLKKPRRSQQAARPRRGRRSAARSEAKARGEVVARLGRLLSNGKESSVPRRGRQDSGVRPCSPLAVKAAADREARRRPQESVWS